jgi:hypothetical protein
MDCPTEETVIRRALLGIDGVTDVRCELMLRRVAVKHADSIETSRILSELSAIGLPGIVASAADREED